MMLAQAPIRMVLRLAYLFIAGPATAQSCAFAVSDINFGSISGGAASTIDTTATMTMSCTGGLPNTVVRVCPNIGPGSAGGTGTARQMSDGTRSVDYQLYQDSARTQVWGSVFAGGFGVPPTFDVALNSSGSGSGARPIYARLTLGATTRPSTYQSLFSGAPTSFFYAPLVNINGCAGITVAAPIAYPTFKAIAAVTATCQVTVPPLDFGSATSLGAAVDATSAMTIACTQGTSYSVALGSGANSQSYTSRRMAAGTSRLDYGLYRDASRTLAWGDAAGTLVTGTGTGLNQPLPIYGRVPAQATPKVGNYTDTVIVTLTY